jgi:hypothetical protein
MDEAGAGLNGELVKKDRAGFFNATKFVTDFCNLLPF